MTIVLHDPVGSSVDIRFSPHCWKTRMSLAHKGLGYQTVPATFVGVPQVENGASRTITEESGRLISSLWHEYEAATTPEARFARALDHLEVQAQLDLASLDTWETVEHDLVYTKMDDRCAYDNALRAMVQAIRVRVEEKLADGGYDVSALRVLRGLSSSIKGFARILNSAIKSPRLKFQGNGLRETHAQKSAFHDRFLRRAMTASGLWLPRRRCGFAPNTVSAMTPATVIGSRA